MHLSATEFPSAETRRNFVELAGPYASCEADLLERAIDDLKRANIRFRLVREADGVHLWRERSGTVGIGDDTLDGGLAAPEPPSTQAAPVVEAGAAL